MLHKEYKRACALREREFFEFVIFSIFVVPCLRILFYVFFKKNFDFGIFFSIFWFLFQDFAVC